MNCSSLENLHYEIPDQLHISELNTEQIYMLSNLNRLIFNQEQIIAKIDARDIIILAAIFNNEIIGFKVGYALSETEFYSAKGCTHPRFRRLGIARKLLWRMILLAQKKKFEWFIFDTFPERYPGMYELGIKEGFTELFRTWNSNYEAEQIRMRKNIKVYPH